MSSKAVLALTSPGTQSMHDVEEARRIARNANDQLKTACERYPDRFYGMIAIAPLDPEWSAQELKRGKVELRKQGARHSEPGRKAGFPHLVADLAPLLKLIEEERARVRLR